MVRCPNCNDIVSVNKSYCPSCGEWMKRSQTSSEGPNYKKLAEIIIIVVIVVAFVSLIIYAGILGMKEANKPHEIRVVVDYDKPWQGAYTTSTGVGGSIDDIGYTEYTITLYKHDIISINAQKQDDSNDLLRITIYDNEELVKSASTTTSYGIAQVTYTVN